MASNLALAGELTKVDYLRQLLGEEAEPQLIMDTFEGETNLLELLDEIVRAIIIDESYSDIVRERVKRLETRAAKRRAIVLQIMERMGIRKAERPEYTLSVANGVPSVTITNEELVPQRYLRTAPDKVAIKSALQAAVDVPGATLNNAPPSLRIFTR